MTTDEIIHEANGMDFRDDNAMSKALDLIIALAHENARLEARIEKLESRPTATCDA